jgi:2-methylisocitrate lyase-like PEP mutase family enzyme
MAIGAYDPSVARLIEGAGFEVAYVSGSGSATAVNGFTDVGLISLKEMLDHARNIIAVTSLPTLCDIDTGNGNVINVKRTIGEYQQIGAAGVHIEDQTFPKRCGQTSGASLISTGEMCAKIYAAKEAADDNFVVAVRTDARQTEGMDGVLARGRAYLDAGCDAIFPRPCWRRSSFWAICAGTAPQRPWLDRMMTRAEVDELLGLPALRADEERLLALGDETVARHTG